MRTWNQNETADRRIVVPDLDCVTTRNLGAERLEPEIVAACPTDADPRNCLEIVRQTGRVDRVRLKGSQ